MEKRLLTFCLFASLTCSAQLPVVPMALSTSPGLPPGPQTIAGLAYYWVSSDYPVGSTVSNWVDRIQGAVWTNGNIFACPTNSATGLYFNGVTNQLTNAIFGSIDVTKDMVWWVVVKPTRINLAQDGFWTRNAGGGTVGFNYYNNFVANGSAANYFDAILNQWQDWIAPITSKSVGNIWTNNVTAKTAFNALASSDSLLALGGYTAPFTKPFQGYLVEFGIYTNTTCTNTSSRAILHTWATNGSSAKPYAP